MTSGVGRFRTRRTMVKVGLLSSALLVVGGVAALAATGTTSGPSGSASLTSTTLPSASSLGGSVTPMAITPGGTTVGVGGFNAVSCISAASCVEVGGDNSGNGVVSLSQAGSSSVTGATLPTGTPNLIGVNCATAGTCVAVGGSSIINSTNSGSSWKLQAVSYPNVSLTGAFCQSATQCLVTGVDSADGLAGNGAIILSSSDGGSTWTPSSIPPGVSGIESIACPTATRCIGVGSLVIVSNDGGQTWQIAPVNGGVIQLTSISCASSTTCISVGPNPLGVSQPSAPGDAVETTDGGSTFQKVTLPSSTASLFEVSCSSSSTCTAAGATGTGASTPTFLGSSTGGATWSTQTAPTGFSAVSGIACPSGGQCIAVGRTSAGASVATATSGGQWNVSQPALSASGFGKSAN
jgi:hypothetical protein